MSLKTETKERQKKKTSFGKMKSIPEEDTKADKNSNSDLPKRPSSQDIKSDTGVPSSSKASSSSTSKGEKTLAQTKQDLLESVPKENLVLVETFITLRAIINSQQKALEEKEEALKDLRTQLNKSGLKILQGLMYMHKGLAEIEGFEGKCGFEGKSRVEDKSGCEEKSGVEEESGVGKVG
jgi:hypothetical protein